MIYAIILGGGRGERFWPKSTISSPKQLLPIISETPMLKETVERISVLVSKENVIIVTPKNLESSIKQQDTSPRRASLLLEPFGRNTAPAIGYAAISIENPDSIMIVLPADHFIPNQQKFIRTMKSGIKIAEMGYLVTFGIVPSRPETGYGYIEAGDRLNAMAYKVKSFKEKPNQKRAQEFIKQENFFWNSGMFIWKVSSILDAIRQHMPEIYKGLLEIKKKKRTPDEVYTDFPNISIDYGVMEKADNVVVIKGDFIWDDVGNWLALERFKDKDRQGNVVEGNLINIDTHDSIIVSDKGLIGTLGIKDCIIVKSGDAILICAKHRAQEVKKLVHKIQERGFERYI